MTERVVHELEAVEIEEQHGNAGAASLALDECELQPFDEERAVRQTCQRIVQSLVADLLFRAVPADGIREDVRDRLEEAHLVQPEATLVARCDAERSEGPVAAVDRNHDHARCAGVLQEHWNRARGVDRGEPQQHRLWARERPQLDRSARLARQPDVRADGVRAPLGLELQHGDDVDLEHGLDSPDELVHQVLGVAPFECDLPEPGDRPLLGDVALELGPGVTQAFARAVERDGRARDLVLHDVEAGRHRARPRPSCARRPARRSTRACAAVELASAERLASLGSGRPAFRVARRSAAAATCGRACAIMPGQHEPDRDRQQRDGHEDVLQHRDRAPAAVRRRGRRPAGSRRRRAPSPAASPRSA